MGGCGWVGGCECGCGCEEVGVGVRFMLSHRATDCVLKSE